MQTLVAAVQNHARGRPEAAACEWLAGDAEEPVAHLTYAELDRRARLIAVVLGKRGLEGQRVLLPFPPGLDFILAFLGCLYAGAVAVPAPFPQNRRTAARTSAILRDCSPRLCLTTGQWMDALRERLATLAVEADGPDYLGLEQLESEGGVGDLPTITGDRLAYLQYTSGTGGTAKGVMITHDNLAHNVATHQAALFQPEALPLLSWLPQYHDMQLVTILCRGLMIGGRCILMSPVDFLQRPVRWLRAISRSGAYVSGGPNFAYEYCLNRIPEQDREGLDLSRWKVAFNSSERIRKDTIDRFERAFAPQGFHSTAWYAGYGLAECTALVTGVSVEDAPQFAEIPGSSTSVACCGKTWGRDMVAIVDAATGSVLPAGQVGEICVRSDSNASGYWNRPEASAALFYQQLPGSTVSGPFLRTGDLGFCDEQGGLYVSGRIKDLIIMRGVNHHPEDIEASVDGCHAALRRGELAVFSIEGRHGDREELVVVAELERTQRHEPDVAAIAEAVQILISREHELTLDHLILLKPGALPKTTSGKTQRTVCRTSYLANKFNPTAVWHRPIAKMPPVS